MIGFRISTNILFFYSMLLLKSFVWTQNINSEIADRQLFISEKSSVIESNKQQINEFDFQTEDYSQELEAELDWINDKQRLEEQNIDSKHYKNKKVDNQNAMTSHRIKGENKGNYYSNYYPNWNSVTNSNILSNKSLDRDFMKPENSTQSISDTHFRNNLNQNISKQLPQNLTSNQKNIESIPRIRAQNLNSDKTSVNENNQRYESTHERVSEWERVVDKNGKSFEQRVITIPQKIYGFPKGLRPIGKTQIVTEPEEVVATEELKPIIEEQEIQLPDKTFG